MEAKKSHCLPSASWRPRKVSGGNPVSPKVWEPGLQMSKAGKKWTSQLKKRETEFAFSSCFYSIPVPSGLDSACPYWGGQSSFLGLLNQMLVSSRNTLTDTHLETILTFFLSAIEYVLRQWIGMIFSDLSTSSGVLGLAGLTFCIPCELVFLRKWVSEYWFPWSKYVWEIPP